MARTNIPVITPIGAFPVLPLTALQAQFVFTAADVANGNSSPMTGRELLIIQNTDAGAQTVTIVSAPDANGRSGDITTYSLPASTFAMLGPFTTSGWRQSSGKLFFNASNANVKFAVVALPSIQ